MKKILPIILSIILLISTNVSVNAQQTTNEFYEVIIDNKVCYTSNDPNLPSQGNYYFGVTTDNKVWYVAINRALPVIINKGIGVVLQPGKLIEFCSDYIEFGIINGIFNKPVYNGNTLIGYAYEDLTGKTLVGSADLPSTNISIPSNETNNVYEYYQEWLEDEGYTLPDYLNFEARNETWYANNLTTTDTNYQGWLDFTNNYTASLKTYSYSSSTLRYNPYIYFFNYDYPNCLFAATLNYEAYCNKLGLNYAHNTVKFVNQMLNDSSNCIAIGRYNIDTSSMVYQRNQVSFSGSTYTVSTKSGSINIGYQSALPCSDKDYVTVYKDTTVLQQVLNETYAPANFYTQQYYDYSSENDNSVTTTQEEINNSTTTNETIYNNSASSFQEYYTENDYNIDNSITITNVTEIVNNYYGSGDDNGGDDNGGGSGGGSDDSDGSLLDRLLNAILDFFKGIAKIITAILTGIFELFNAILEAIANITTSFEGITNLFSAIFGWLPDPIINLMVLGLGLALLAAFITWFR